MTHAIHKPMHFLLAFAVLGLWSAVALILLLLFPRLTLIVGLCAALAFLAVFKRLVPSTLGRRGRTPGAADRLTR